MILERVINQSDARLPERPEKKGGDGMYLRQELFIRGGGVVPREKLVKENRQGKRRGKQARRVSRAALKRILSDAAKTTNLNTKKDCLHGAPRRWARLWGNAPARETAAKQNNETAAGGESRRIEHRLQRRN